jgi:hypothetical protein
VIDGESCAYMVGIGVLILRGILGKDCGGG